MMALSSGAASGSQISMANPTIWQSSVKAIHGLRSAWRAASMGRVSAAAACATERIATSMPLLEALQPCVW